jgi:hypothetical protein
MRSRGLVSYILHSDPWLLSHLTESPVVSVCHGGLVHVKTSSTTVSLVRLPKGGDESSYKRLVGWKRIRLAAGESQTVTVAIDARALKTFNEANDTWNFTPGDYDVFVGGSSDSTPLTGNLQAAE